MSSSPPPPASLSSWFDEHVPTQVSKQLTLIQSHCRRTYVQRQLRSARRSFERIFGELEGEEADVTPVWKHSDGLASPRFVSKHLKPKQQRLQPPSKLQQTVNTTEKPKAASGNDAIQENNVEQVEQSQQQQQQQQQQKQKPTPDAALMSSSPVETTRKTSSLTTAEATTAPNGESTVNCLEINADQLNYLELDNLRRMSKNELINVREGVSLEMLWIQQAIQSRIQYLNMKKSLQNQKSLHSNNNEQLSSDK